MRRLFSSVLAVLLAAGLHSAPTHAVPVAEVRGDFYYDAEGRLVGMKHVAPPSEDRRPMSNKERFRMLGLELPRQRATLEPRPAHAKPQSVTVTERTLTDRVTVKFVEGTRVRLRAGGLEASGGSISDFEAVLAGYPGATIERLFRIDESILDDNKETGELISGKELADLNNWYVVRFPQATPRSVDLANELLALASVETAYLENEPAPPPCVDIAPTTPSYEANQFYLGAAPDGLDAYYAWNYHPGGRGASGFWVIDMEYSWCYTHEDVPVTTADVLNAITVGAYEDGNHGIAVLSEIGACDNSYGVTGMTPDLEMRMIDVDTDGHAGSVALADSWLYPGEILLIEQQVWGPTGELLPVEWVDATFDAIVIAVANGKIVVEAAANGSSDLDDAIYLSKFNRSFRNSGAILVGAGTPGGHVPEWFTNYGSRVDLHGFGSGIYSAGYGIIFSGDATCSQDYRADFGGTSGASPMITSAAAALQGIANEKYGFDLSPAQMLTSLLAGATPQGAPTSQNIGPMPDLVDAINWIEPDLVPYTPAGWDNPIVVRNTAGVTSGSATVTVPALPGNATGGTFYNWTIRNEPYAYAPADLGWTTGIYLEDDLIMFGVSGSTILNPGDWGFWANLNPTIFHKGGRHSVTSIMNDNFGIEEWWYGNNEAWEQYIWSPLVLSPDVPQSRTDDPIAVSMNYSYYNAEGIQGTTGSNYWHAFAVMPTSSSDDFDIRLNTETPLNVPEQGFGASVEQSWTAAGDVAFVIVDANDAGAGTYYASVLNLSGAGSANKVVEFEEDSGLLSEGTWGTYTIGSGDIIELHEVYLNSGTEYRIHVEWISGSADYGLSVHGSTAGFYGKDDVVLNGDSDFHGAGEDEWVVVEATTSGFHGIAVWKSDSDDLNQALSYNLHISQDPNLVSSLTPSGWDAPIVPRSTQDALSFLVPLPDSLIGNAAATSFNWNAYNQGANQAPAPWWTDLYLDDVLTLIQSGLTLNSGAIQPVLNSGYTFVRGGRHHVRAIADALDQLTEFDETDNEHTEGFVWTPMVLADHTPVTRSAPPVANPEGYWWYSSDGFRSELDGTFWQGVAVMPVSPSDGYMVRIHDPSTGPQNGFDANLAFNAAPDGKNSFCVTNLNAALWQPHDYGVVNLWTGGSGDFVVQKSSGPYRGTVFAAGEQFGPYTISGDNILDLHEIWVDGGAVGVPMYVSLDNLSGDADLGIAMFEPGTGYLSQGSATWWENSAGDGMDEHLGAITFTTEGYYGIAVFKDGSSDLGKSNDYRIVLSTTDVTGVDVGPVAPTELSLAAPQPNPFGSQTRFQYALPAESPVKISVYDLQGRRIATLVDGAAPAGRHTVQWDGRDSTGRRSVAGIYFVRLETPSGHETRKVTLMR